MHPFHTWKIRRISKKIQSLRTYRLHNQPKDAALKKEVALCNELSKLYTKRIGDKKYPFAQIMANECLRLAASLNDPEANYQLGKRLFYDAQFRSDLELSGVFSSPANEKHSVELYEEAHAYLMAAEQLSHIGAKRFRGVCYINGWGVKADKTLGFELVVSSIEQEGSWDKVPQIFASIGLNKPEFFSAIMQRRKDSNTSV